MFICNRYKDDGAEVIHRHLGIDGGQDPKAKDAGESALRGENVVCRNGFL